MPRRSDLNHILVIGSGPIVIGQACEFDYSGSQACRVLREEGLQVTLVNSNPATIMTDPEYADQTYVEPITAAFVEKVIAQQAERGNKIDALLATLGGQTALNTAVALYENGALERHNIELIGADFEAIQRGEDRQKFKDIVARVGGESARSRVCFSMEEVREISGGAAIIGGSEVHVAEVIPEASTYANEEHARARDAAKANADEWTAGKIALLSEATAELVEDLQRDDALHPDDRVPIIAGAKSKLRAWCELHAADVASVYAHPGTSGAKRKLWNALLAYAKACDVSDTDMRAWLSGGAS